MPYFYRNDSRGENVNILFVHIPKTGGTSFELYLSKRYKIPLNVYSLYGQFPNMGDSSSPQHYTLREIWIRRKEMRICEDNLRIIAFVRNPYTRLMSDLFFLNTVSASTPPEVVTRRLRHYLTNNKTNYDNHRLPQVNFLVNSKKQMWKGVEIVRMESLTHDLAQIGFDDFNHHDSIKTKAQYTELFNDEAYELVNNYYYQDFITFGYNMTYPASKNPSSYLRNRKLSAIAYNTNVLCEFRCLVWFCIMVVILTIVVKLKY